MLKHRKFIDYLQELQDNFVRLDAIDDAISPFATVGFPIHLSSIAEKPLHLAISLFEELLFPGAIPEVEYYIYELNFGRDAEKATDCITVSWEIINQTKTYSLRNHEEFYQYLLDCEKYSR